MLRPSGFQTAGPRVPSMGSCFGFAPGVVGLRWMALSGVRKKIWPDFEMEACSLPLGTSVITRVFDFIAAAVATSMSLLLSTMAMLAPSSEREIPLWKMSGEEAL